MALIGISGKIGSGKDTVGKIIQYITSEFNGSFDEYITRDLGGSVWEIKKFATKLKQMICLLTGCTMEQLEDQAFKNTYLPEEWDWYKTIGADSNGRPIYLRSPVTDVIRKEMGDRVYKTTYRELLQLLGTEALRHVIHENCHVNALFADYKSITNILFEEDHKRLLSIWKNMNTRCNNPNYEKYHKYGGKGIRVCEEWSNFDVFVKWAEENYYDSKLTLDRKDIDGNYTPSNCRWVTTALQGFNKNKYKSSKSSKGVYYKEPNKKWVAQIQSKSIKEHIGYYDTEEQAVENYNKRYDQILRELESEVTKYHLLPNWIITDCRFENEAKAIKDRGGIIIRVNRVYECNQQDVNGDCSYPNCDCQNTGNHPSETSLDNYVFDYVIENDGTIEELIEKVKQILIQKKII